MIISIIFPKDWRRNSRTEIAFSFSPIWLGDRQEKINPLLFGERFSFRTFHEETLQVESVTEHIEHFPLLEIDYVFYRLLLDWRKIGRPRRIFVSFDSSPLYG